MFRQYLNFKKVHLIKRRVWFYFMSSEMLLNSSGLCLTANWGTVSGSGMIHGRITAEIGSKFTKLGKTVYYLCHNETCLFIHVVHSTNVFHNQISDRCSQNITLIQIGSTAMVYSIGQVILGREGVQFAQYIM